MHTHRTWTAAFRSGNSTAGIEWNLWIRLCARTHTGTRTRIRSCSHCVRRPVSSRCACLPRSAAGAIELAWRVSLVGRGHGEAGDL